MEQWEFLLQKEGDRSWLPLESPAVEILEGRYRVVARSGRASETVAIRITHQDLEEFPPKRRVHKRTTDISPEGLLLMIPFTSLKPGIWELQCTNETTPENPEPIWQHAMRLMVLPADAYSDSDLESDSPETGEIEAGETPAAAQTPEVAKPPVTPGAIITNAGVSLPVAPYAQESPSVPPNLPPLTLSLERDTYIVAWGGQFDLAGQVEALLDGEIPPISGLELYVSLRDPQTGKILAQVRQELPSEVPPLFFSCPVAIGAECRTHLILGEVNICTGGEGGQGEEKILASQSLTIVADVDNLMEVVPEGLREEDILEFSPETLIRQEAEALDKSFEDLRSTIKNSPPLQLQPAANPVLPPLLNQTGREQQPKPKLKSLDLPSLGRRTPENPTPPRPNTATASPPPPTEQGTPAPAAEDLKETPPDELSLPAADVMVDLPLVKEMGERQPPPPNPVDAAFQGLHLRERFFSRLSALAGDRELSEWLQANVSQAKQQEEEPAADEEQQAPSAETKPEPGAVDWEAREIVVDDDPLEVATPYQSGGLVAVPPMGLVLPSDQPVPEPRLQVKGGELVAGRRVEVAVQLPLYQPAIPIYVKLWVRDRQTRQLLDGPHWLTQFWPTGMGDVEGKIQLTIPKGTLEVQLEAIAVEAQTQRESRKATIDRPVAPPPLPSLPEYDSEV